jgi:hypothetical protein
LRALQKISIVSFFIILISGCDKTVKEKEIEAIVINYKVEYLDKTAGSIPTNVLPKKMKLVLGDRYAMNSIKGFFGQFSLTYIANIKKDKVITLLKIFNEKLYYEGKKGELPCNIDEMEGLMITKTGNTREMLGFNCEEFEFLLPDKELMSVYGTNEIDFSSPNKTTPYNEIEEVLLQFYTKLDVLEMFLTAENYIEENLSTKVFAIPEGYKEVSRTKMENTITSLFK